MRDRVGPSGDRPVDAPRIVGASADASPGAAVLAGVGIGWRPEIAPVVAGMAGVDFVEVVAENVSCAFATPRGIEEDVGSIDHPSARVDLAAYVARGVPVVPHGVGLSLGSADTADLGPVHVLADVAAGLGSPLVSEHLAFVRGGGIDAGHLLPCPRTREAVAVVARNVARVRDRLPVPLALEMPATLLTWPDDELTDAQFVTECLAATGCGLVLDIANVYANAVNGGRDPAADLEAYPLERIAYCHIAGGVWDDGVYLDTHTHPVVPEVLDLAAHLASRRPGAPVLLERDGNYPFPDVLTAELADIRRRVAPSAQSRSNAETGAGSPMPRKAGSGPAALPDAVGRRGGESPGRDQDLAGRQADLVAALVRGAPPPAGFDPVGVERTARTLVRKRWAAVRRHWPVATAALLGAEPGRSMAGFAEWATAHRDAGGLPLGGLLDGWTFLDWTATRYGLPDAAAVELATRGLTHRLATGPSGEPTLVRRRWVGVGNSRVGQVTVRAVGRASAPRHVRIATRESGPPAEPNG